MKGAAFAGVLRLSWFIVRQDRMRYIWWLFGIVVMTLIVPPAFKELYPTQQDRDAMAVAMDNPVMTALFGPGDFANYTIGAMLAHQMLLMTAIAVAVMNILLMMRHTRTEEEDGRAELLRSLPIVQYAQLLASILVLFCLNVVLALLIGSGLSAFPYDGMGVSGSFIYGISLGATGFFFATVAALCAQLTESSRGALGLSFIVMVGGYLLLSVSKWMPPFGWLTQVQPYSDNNSIAVGGIFVVGLLLCAIAVMLHGKRDIGSGLLPSRSGRAHASPLLRSPIGLAWRLQRTTFIYWSAGILALGVMYGSVLGDMEQFFNDNEMMASMIIVDENSSLAAQFLPMLMVVMAFIGTIPALLSIHKLVAEERRERVNNLLGRAVSRRKLLISYLILALFTGFAMLSFSALGLWLAGTFSMEEPFTFGTIWMASIVHLPAVAVMIAVSTLLIGLSQKAAVFSWFYLVYGFITLYLGNLFQLPGWMEKLSPFGFVPKLPIEDMNWSSAGGLTLVAAVLIGVGIDRYVKRDIER